MNETNNKHPRNFILVGMAMIVVFLAIPLAHPNFRIGGGGFGSDFLQEYIGSAIVLRGDRDKLYEGSYNLPWQSDPKIVGEREETDIYYPMVYPPFYYLITSVFTQFSYRNAVFLWFATMAAFFLAWIGLIVWKQRSSNKTLPPVFFLLALLYPPLLRSLIMNQKATVLLFLFTASYFLLRKKRPFQAGLVFGLVMFKPHLALLIALAMTLKGQWRFFAGGFVTSLALGFLSLVVGQGACEGFIRMIFGMGDYIHTEGFPLNRMHCLYGQGKLLMPGAELYTVQALSGLLIFGVLAALIRILKGPIDTGSKRFSLQFTALILGTILTSPHLLTYDLSLLLLPFFILFKSWNEESSFDQRQRLIVLGIFLATTLTPDMAEITRIQGSVLAMLWWFGELLVHCEKGESEEIESASLSA